MKEIKFLKFNWIKLIVVIVVMFLSWYLSVKFAVIGYLGKDGTPTQPFIVKFFNAIFIVALIYLIINIIYSIIIKLKK